MKVTCLMGSPRQESNSAKIAERFNRTAERLGAVVGTFVLNDLNYRGCQACMSCKTGSERCVLPDDLAAVLEELKKTDVIVMALPIYCADVPGQVKCFIDRTFSYMKPDYVSGMHPSRVPAGKRLVFIVTQGAPMQDLFADVPARYQDFLKRCMALGETHLIRAVGVGGGGAVGVPDQFLEEAEQLARTIFRS